MAKKVKDKKWLVVNKCYAKGTLYLAGDTVSGDVDFSDNDNFKDITDEKDVTTEVDEENGNGNDIPSVNAE